MSVAVQLQQSRFLITGIASYQAAALYFSSLILLCPLFLLLHLPRLAKPSSHRSPSLEMSAPSPSPSPSSNLL